MANPYQIAATPVRRRAILALPPVMAAAAVTIPAPANAATGRAGDRVLECAADLVAR
jgi:hypothetical protein